MITSPRAGLVTVRRGAAGSPDVVALGWSQPWARPSRRRRSAGRSAEGVTAGKPAEGWLACQSCWSVWQPLGRRDRLVDQEPVHAENAREQHEQLVPASHCGGDPGRVETSSTRLLVRATASGSGSGHFEARECGAWLRDLAARVTTLGGDALGSRREEGHHMFCDVPACGNEFR